MEVTVKQVLLYLEDAGWTELIDARFERDVTREIAFVFPDITPEVFDEVLDTVIVRRSE